MLNQCSFIGNLGADPEVRSFQSGGKVCNLRLAVTEKWKNSAGERQEKTEWVSIAIFNEGLVGVAERFLRKGSKVFIQGQMATRKWSDASGNDRYSTEIVLRGPHGTLTMLDGAQGGSGGQGGGSSSSGGSWGGQQKRDLPPPDDDLDDDIPF